MYKRQTEGLGFIHFSVHDGESRETITSDLFYKCLTFPRDEIGFHLYATRRYPTPQTLAAVPATCGGDILPLSLAIVPHTLSPLSMEGVVCRNMDVNTHVYVHVQSLRASILSIIFVWGETR